MAYQKQEWHDLPLEDTPISAERLTHMEQGIYDAWEHGGGESIPIGGIMSFGGSIEPTGWLFCNGQAVSRTNYAELFEAIGTTFGEGDGSTTFNVPDFSSRSPMGVGTGTDQNGDTMITNLGMNYGEYQHTLTVSEMPSHNHSSQGYAKVVDNGSFYALITNGSDTNKTTRNTGGDQAHNTVHPVLGVNYIIKATEVTPNQSNVINQRSNSTLDTYSCDYVNKLNTYSTEETVIGTWIDGKPIYRKTINFGNLPNNTSKDVAHNISNIDTFVKIYGIAKSSSNQLPLPYTNPNNVNYGILIQCSTTNITAEAKYDRSNYTANIILEYTKTTD